MPQKSLIDDIYDFLSKTTPTDKNFYLLSSYFVMSAISTNNVSIIMPYGRVKTNLWVLLIGPSTISHKTTLLNVVYGLISEVAPDVLISQDYSPEGLFQELDELGDHGEHDVTAVAIRDEMSGLIESANKKDYMANIKEFLMELYDHRVKISRRLKKEKLVIKQPYFAWLTATSEQRFFEVFKYSDISNGFLARFMIAIYDKDNVYDQISTDVVEFNKTKTDLITKLRTINTTLRSKRFDFYLTPKAMNKYVEYINDNGRWLEEGLLTIKSRLSVAVLKISALNYIAEHYKEMAYTIDDTNDLFLNESDIQKAIDIVEHYLQISSELLMQMDIAPIIRRIIKILEGHTIMSHSELLWRSHLKASEFKSYIDTMLEAGILVKSVKKDGDKQIIYYTLAETLQEVSINNDKPVANI